jgi:DNA-binding NtrC family response regulator
MDLWYRLNAFHLKVPPLRERQDDIGVLARHFLELFAERYNKKPVKTLSPEAEAVLRSYRWPGNIRELRNLVERIVVLESAGEIRPVHLPDWLTEHGESTTKDGSVGGFVLPSAGIDLEKVERDLIKQALERTQNNKTQAASLLGITYDTLRYQVKKFGLE